MTAPEQGPVSRARLAAATRFLVVAATAFLTLVDLFAAQAILPPLTTAYGVSPAAMATAVNACTIGMAFGGLGVALFGDRIDRRFGILVSLGLLAIPTLSLSLLPALPVFFALRVVQGLFMAAAFGLTLAYLGEHLSAADTAAGFAAYISGNVASNLIGRLVAAGIVDKLGLAANFEIFAALNVLGAVLVYLTVEACPTMHRGAASGARPAAALLALARDGRLAAGFGIGFCLLFAFIGTFTFVNFVLVRPPLDLGMMQVGLVYFVFLPSILTTPMAGVVAARAGARPALLLGLLVALAGLPLLLSARLDTVLAGMVLVAVGTFFAQAVATGWVSRAAEMDRGAAGGLYLTFYFAGGLAGSLALGQVFDRAGWAACVAGVGIALLAACGLSVRLRPPRMQPIVNE